MRALWTPKKGSSEAEWEDGFCFEEATGRAAIADGASSAMGASSWARCLCRGWVLDPPMALSEAELAPWLLRRQAAWFPPQAAIATENHEWWANAATSRGSWATLAAVAISDQEVGWSIEAGAIGDTCLFLIRQGVVVAQLPTLGPNDFGTHPDLVGTPASSVSRTVGALCSTTMLASDGDVLLGATDALAEWAIQTSIAQPEVWDTLSVLDQGSLTDLVAAERDAGRMENDDVTLLRCHLGVM